MSRCEDTCIIFAGLPEAPGDGESNNTMGFGTSNAAPSLNASSGNRRIPASLPTVSENAPEVTEELPAQNSPEVICFPSPGVFPIDFLMCPYIPWSIMPCSSLYQPTHRTAVQMW